MITNNSEDKIYFSKIFSIIKPKNFLEVFGQNNVINFLQKAIEFDLIPNAIIFYGMFGCGKTLLARIFAKTSICESQNIYKRPCLNCGPCSCIDIHEFNSANYTQVDNIRELIQDARIIPSISKYKFYILDEFHMLSNKSFNALLKEIEEPNNFTKFIFITTEIENIPETLISRCFLLHVGSISEENLKKILLSFFTKISENKKIVEKINFKNPSEEELCTIIKNSDGSARNAINIAIRFLMTKELVFRNKISRNEVLSFINNIINKDVNIKAFMFYFNNFVKKYDVSYSESHKLLLSSIENEIMHSNANLNINPIIISQIIDILLEGYKKTKIVECSYIWTLIMLKTTIQQQ